MKLGSKGFTLVELIVVISIIAVLSALALPSYKIVLAHSNSSRCLSNLRALGASLNLYLADHGMTMPQMVAARESTAQQDPALDTVLAPYVDDKSVFVCPAGRAIAMTTGTSYSWNNALNGQNFNSLNMFGVLNTLSSIPVFFDKSAFHQYAGSPVNMLYADGHAQN